MNYPDYDENKVKILKLDSFFDLMEHLRAKPALFLGTNRSSSFIALTAFLYGYQFKNYDDDYHSFLMWLGMNVTTSSSPFYYMEQTYQEGAYDKFWEFYDQFIEERKNEETEPEGGLNS